jgi:hypothetical protein
VIPSQREGFDVVMGDEAIIRVRRHGRPDGIRLFISNGNGFATDGYYPFWGPLTDDFGVIVFDFRNHGANPLAASGKDGYTYAQMTLDLERVRRTVDTRLGARTSIGVFHSMSARTAMKHRRGVRRAREDDRRRPGRAGRAGAGLCQPGAGRRARLRVRGGPRHRPHAADPEARGVSPGYAQLPRGARSPKLTVSE